MTRDSAPHVKTSAGTWTRRTVLGLFLAVMSCDSPFSPTGDVQVRVSNESSFAFGDVEVTFPENHVDYGVVAANGVSEYRRVTKAYGYALIVVQVGGEELRIQPIDYLGESLLPPGRYTYALNVTIEGQLTLDLRDDN
jgi:hypothetical protein